MSVFIHFLPIPIRRLSLSNCWRVRRVVPRNLCSLEGARLSDLTRGFRSSLCCSIDLRFTDVAPFFNESYIDSLGSSLFQLFTTFKGFFFFLDCSPNPFFFFFFFSSSTAEPVQLLARPLFGPSSYSSFSWTAVLVQL